jgi:hypothetical protein
MSPLLLARLAYTHSLTGRKHAMPAHPATVPHHPLSSSSGAYSGSSGRRSEPSSGVGGMMRTLGVGGEDTELYHRGSEARIVTSESVGEQVGEAVVTICRVAGWG